MPSRANQSPMPLRSSKVRPWLLTPYISASAAGLPCWLATLEHCFGVRRNTGERFSASVAPWLQRRLRVRWSMPGMPMCS